MIRVRVKRLDGDVQDGILLNVEEPGCASVLLEDGEICHTHQTNIKVLNLKELFPVKVVKVRCAYFNKSRCKGYKCAARKLHMKTEQCDSFVCWRTTDLVYCKPVE